MQSIKKNNNLDILNLEIEALEDREEFFALCGINACGAAVIVLCGVDVAVGCLIDANI